jgi:hypothetical protein
MTNDRFSGKASVLAPVLQAVGPFQFSHFCEAQSKSLKQPKPVASLAALQGKGFRFQVEAVSGPL